MMFYGLGEDAADELIRLFRDLRRVTKGSSLAWRRRCSNEIRRAVEKIGMDLKTVNPTDFVSARAHNPLGAHVQTIDLLGVAQEVGLREAGLLG